MALIIRTPTKAPPIYGKGHVVRDEEVRGPGIQRDAAFKGIIGRIHRQLGSREKTGMALGLRVAFEFWLTLCLKLQKQV